MSSRSESSKIREVQVLGNQESLVLLRRFPNLAVTLATQVFFGDSVNVVAEICQACGQMRRKIFVELDPHRMCGVAGTGRSSSAEAAAKAIAACTSSIFRAGNAARISSTESPAAKLANTVRSGTRVPRKTGSPPQIFASLTILSSGFTSGHPFPKLFARLLNEHHTIAFGAGGVQVVEMARDGKAPAPHREHMSQAEERPVCPRVLPRVLPPYLHRS
jgi:hypothetical protein